MNYGVQVVADDELPAGIKRVIVERSGGQQPLLLLAESVAGTWAFIQEWETAQRVPAQVFELRAV